MGGERLLPQSALMALLAHHGIEEPGELGLRRALADA